MGGYHSWDVVAVGSTRQNWLKLGIGSFIVKDPMWPPLSAAQPHLQDQPGDLSDPIRESPK